MVHDAQGAARLSGALRALKLDTSPEPPVTVLRSFDLSRVTLEVTELATLRAIGVNRVRSARRVVRVGVRSEATKDS